MTTDVGAVVPAAGKGRRLGSRQAKAFVPVARAPLVIHTLQALQRASSIRWIVVVVPPGEEARMQRLVRRYQLAKVSSVVRGEATRSASVMRGFAALPSQARWVLIHDGARPCVTTALIESLIRRARRDNAVACGLPASLTIKAVDANHQVRLTLDRDQLWFVQTPQVFQREWLVEALTRVNGQLDRFPDDAALLEWAGFTVRLVPGDPLNIKVTTKEDLWLAETILMRRLRSQEKRTTPSSDI